MMTAVPAVLDEPVLTAAIPGVPQHRDEATVVVATGVVSVLNYAYTVILLWLLPAANFSVVASVSALLLICGTVSGAAIPWVLAREVVRSPHDPGRRKAAVGFCLLATAVQAVFAGIATALVTVHYAGGPVVAAELGSVVMIFTAATAAGYLQGLQRFRLLAVLRVSEVVVKIGAGVALVALGAGAGGAIAGFAIGAAVVAAGALIVMAPDIGFVRSALIDRDLWVNARGLLLIQAGVAIIAGLDIVVSSIVVHDHAHLATYQAAVIFGRTPVFIATSLSIVAFPRLVSEGIDRTRATRDILALYVKLGVAVFMLTATLPQTLTHRLFPATYGNVAALLPLVALGGLAMGAVNLLTTFFQAAAVFRRAIAILAAGVVLSAALDVEAVRGGNLRRLAVVVAAAGTIITVALCVDLVREWPGSLRGVATPAVTALIVCSPLVLLRGHLGFWAVWAVVAVVVPAFVHLRSFNQAAHILDSPGRRPRVLHLGYEDPARPASGGGSLRTHEINRLLADDFEITVVCARYRGCRSRVDDRVRYVHVGLPLGYFGSILAYYACLPYALLRYRSDLVVEDFGAPFSSVAVPWMTERPVVGVVQWLFARQKSSQYHVPFHAIERLGLRSHHCLIAVSDDLADEIRTRNRDAEVVVVANGLEESAFESRCLPRHDLIYLGRLEIAQKGLDLLIEAYASIAGEIDQDLVLGGDGPDRPAVERLVRRLGIESRVKFAGRISPEDRFDFLARGEVLLMPSRYETFGMVAAEALAVGTPVVAFDIACLRSLIDSDVGIVVPPFDVDAFASAVRELAHDSHRRAALGAAGPMRVAGYRWESLARAQGEVYRRRLVPSAPARGAHLVAAADR